MRDCEAADRDDTHDINGRGRTINMVYSKLTIYLNFRSRAKLRESGLYSIICKVYKKNRFYVLVGEFTDVNCVL